MFFKFLKVLIFSIIILSCNKDDSNPKMQDGRARVGETGTCYRRITLDKIERDYILYAPESYDGSRPVPLVLNFHGYTQSASYQMSFGDMRSIADTVTFILVYPQGSLLDGKAHWNVGSIPQGSNADDVGFTEAILNDITNDYNIDKTRIYACGYSNGGCFSFELACHLSDRIAAIGSVSGTMTDRMIETYKTSHPMPVVTINGSADNMVKYDGTAPVSVLSQREVLEFWIDFNNTDVTPVITKMADVEPNDASRVELYEYQNGDNGVSVAHYKVISGGHDWPGKTGNMDIDASNIIWNFVSKYDINGLIDLE